MTKKKLYFLEKFSKTTINYRKNTVSVIVKTELLSENYLLYLRSLSELCLSNSIETINF